MICGKLIDMGLVINIPMLLLFTVKGALGDDVTTRLMYDSMAQLVGDASYPDNW